MFQKLHTVFQGAPQENEIKYLFSEKNPFFEEGEVRLFSCEANTLVGFYHPSYQTEGKAYVGFGYWHFNGEARAKECFHQLKSWAIEKGADQILGPINFSTLHSYRLPLEAYEKNFMGEPAGSLDQVQCLKDIGFVTHQRYSSFFIKNPEKIYKWGQKRSEKILKQSSEFRALGYGDFNFRERKEELYELIHNIFKTNLGYLKPSSYELDYLYNEQLLEKLSHFPFFFVENNEGRLVGLFMSFLGEDVFSGEPRPVLYFKTIGSEPSKFGHNKVFFFLIHEIYRRYDQLNMSVPICFSLMREGNVAEKVARMFSDQKRTYGLFRLNL